jgi:hypothetical protein
MFFGGELGNENRLQCRVYPLTETAQGYVVNTKDCEIVNERSYLLAAILHLPDVL